ncbi:MAG: hypothetical protein NC430_03955 [bacterium]|nr:hypothetical protein [bacterium]MCM1424273.1 hypothetical protein [bacterium]
MEELLVYAILLYEKFVTESEYAERLDKLFLSTPESDTLLYETLLDLEWETDIKEAVIYMRTHFDYRNFDYEQFGRAFMSELRKFYADCTDIKCFANQMYDLWKNLPENIQTVEPFWTLSYAGDSLSWGDEKQARSLYEYVLNYYKD